MGSFQSNVVAKNSNKKKNFFQKDSVHITTNDFFYLCPAFCREVMESEDITVDMSVFSRATPMQKPAYVDVSIKNRAFYVPYHSVFPQFNDFLTENRSNNGVTYSSVPNLTAWQLISFFIHEDQFTADGNRMFTVAGPSTGVECDIRVDCIGDTSLPSADRIVHRYNFTALGKRFWHIVTGLGYNVALHCESKNLKTMPNLSALPLLSMLRIWSDWYRPTNFETAVSVKDSQQQTLVFVVDEFFTEQHWHTGLSVYPWDICAIAQWLTMVPFARDYYNIAQPKPIASATSQNIAIEDPTGSANNAVNSNNATNLGTPYIDDAHGSGSAITRWTIQALNALTNWMRRNQIAGYRTLDRYLAQYGVKLSSESLERAVYLGEQVTPLDVSAVFSQANTFVPDTSGGSLLGDYAGSGVIDPRRSNGGHFTYSATEFGQFIIVSQFIPKASYYQGIKREMLHIHKFDFANGDYDALDYQAMPLCELVSFGGTYGDVSPDAPIDFKSVYGFVPRYAEYKQSDNQDVLDGDFRVFSAGARSYKDMHLFRTLPFKAGMSAERQYEIATWNAAQFDRIFANQDAIYDHFLTYYQFRVQSWLPLSRLFEQYGPEQMQNDSSELHVGGSQFE